MTTIDDLNDPAILQTYRAQQRGQADSAPALVECLRLYSSLPAPKTEYRFHPIRRFRFDIAYPELRIAVEVDGGQWKPFGGRHSRNSDYEKRREAQRLGWLVVAFTAEELAMNPLRCVQDLEAIVEANREWKPSGKF